VGLKVSQGKSLWVLFVPYFKNQQNDRAMTIQREGNFLVDKDYKGRLSIGIESDQIEACLSKVLSLPTIGVFGSPCFNFLEDNLDFLPCIPDIEKIWFWDIKLRSIDGVYALKNLKHFGIHPARPSIDFGRLPTLEEVVWTPRAKDRGIDSLINLTLLHVWHYQPKSKNFGGLTLPFLLTELQFNWANSTSLEGLPKFNNLKRLEMNYCRNLETLKYLPQIAPNLEYLVVSSCRKIADGEDVIQDLPKLKHAFINDSVLVSA
jgi:hypothetical protein